MSKVCSIAPPTQFTQYSKFWQTRSMNVPFNLTSFSTIEQFMKRFTASLIFTSSSESLTPSNSLNEHGCLYWLTEWQLYLSHVHTSSDPYGDQICTQRVSTQVTLTTIPPLDTETMYDNTYFPHALFLCAYPGASLQWWHAACTCPFTCLCPQASTETVSVTALCHVFILSPWCVLLGSRGSNTRWLLILGCSICYAGAPPSLVFHVECHCIRHVS